MEPGEGYKGLKVETKEWSPGLDTVLPVSGIKIPKFSSWINFNGFNFDKSTGKGHKGFDFAAYLTDDQKIMLGLPQGTQVEAVADGYVKISAKGTTRGESDYYGEIRIQHGESDTDLMSVYGHVIPSVQINDKVKKGEVIGILYSSRGGDIGYLTHLHLQLLNGDLKTLADPRTIDEEIYRYSAEPQGNAGFTVPELEGVQIQIANFKHLILPNL